MPGSVPSSTPKGCVPLQVITRGLRTFTQQLGRLWHAMGDTRGDLSSYLAQGVLAVAAISIAGVVFIAFQGVGTKLQDIVDTLVKMQG